MYSGRGKRTRVGPAGQQGVTTIEYLVVTVIFLLALVAAPDVIPELMEAIRKMYQAFTFAVSTSYPSPTPEDLGL